VTHPQAYLFFVPFIVISVFAVLNLFIAVLTNSMQEMQKEELVAEEKMLTSSQQTVIAEITALRKEIETLRAALERR
jgi:voltage-gated sodium channel